jgi:hypothetical protein
MEESSQLHISATIYTVQKDSWHPLDRRLVETWSLSTHHRLQEISFAGDGYQTPVIISVVKHYTG